MAVRTIQPATQQQGPPPPPTEGFGGSGGGRPGGASRRASLTGIFVLIAGIVMFFGAFTSAMVVRRGLGGDWVSTPLPPILWWNTLVLLGSSAALEMARRGLRRGERGRFNLWWTSGMALGAVFLAGQYIAWQNLRAAGIYLATNPSSSFLYLLTVLHALHVIGGVAALAYIDMQALRLRLGPGKRTAVDVAGIYWHFLAGLWIYLLLLFRFWG
jgi:cytochrome c oxidase subunit 3